MKTLKLHHLLPALLLAIAPFAVGCGREEPSEDQVLVEEPRQQNPAADESYDISDSETAGEAQDPELPRRQVVVVEPEAGEEAGAMNDELATRERELARREAELAERERRLREPRDRVARQEPQPEPERKPVPPAAPKAKSKPQPEERIARKPGPKPAPPAVSKPKPKPEERSEDRIARKPEPKPEPRTERETEREAERRAERKTERETVRETERETEEIAERERADDNSGWVGRRAERERQTDPQPMSVTLPAGTVVEVEVLEDLSSQTSRVGDTFRARVASTVKEDGAVAIPAGAEVVGEVTEVTPLRKVGGRARLGVKFTDLVLPSGATVPIDASFSQTGRNETGKDAATIGGAAAGGAVLGRILNRKDRSKGSVIGAIIGAAAGTVLASRTPGEEILIPRGTAMNLELRDSVRVRR